MWHQLVLNVLQDIPRSLTTNKGITEAFYYLEKEKDKKDRTELKESDINGFKKHYTSDNALSWYIRGSFLYRALDIVWRTINSDAIISFHSTIKGLTT